MTTIRRGSVDERGGDAGGRGTLVAQEDERTGRPEHADGEEDGEQGEACEVEAPAVRSSGGKELRGKRGGENREDREQHARAGVDSGDRALGNEEDEERDEDGAGDEREIAAAAREQHGKRPRCHDEHRVRMNQREGAILAAREAEERERGDDREHGEGGELEGLGGTRAARRERGSSDQRGEDRAREKQRQAREARIQKKRGECARRMKRERRPIRFDVNAPRRSGHREIPREKCSDAECASDARSAQWSVARAERSPSQWRPRHRTAAFLRAGAPRLPREFPRSWDERAPRP